MGKKKKGRSTQELTGIQNFTRYGLATNRGELLFFLVSPTNISVLSHTNIEIKIRHLMMVSPSHLERQKSIRYNGKKRRKIRWETKKA